MEEEWTMAVPRKSKIFRLIADNISRIILFFLKKRLKFYANKIKTNYYSFF
jgi:hypothetical protein